MHKIEETIFGEFWVTSHKPHLGWSTLDKACRTLDEAKAYCEENGLPYKITMFADRATSEPDFGQDYRSYYDKELAYEYYEA